MAGPLNRAPLTRTKDGGNPTSAGPAPAYRRQRDDGWGSPIEVIPMTGGTAMSLIDDALRANATITADRTPIDVVPPAPRIAIVTCADPRVSGLVRLLGLDDADVDLIRNVGTVIDEDSLRSLIISTRVLGTSEIMIVNHDDCGMLRFTDDELHARLRAETGASPVVPARFYSFSDTEEDTREQVRRARTHPWISADMPIRGFVLDLATGRLTEVLP
jgi:carbonic anhydrase